MQEDSPTRDGVAGPTSQHPEHALFAGAGIPDGA